MPNFDNLANPHANQEETSNKVFATPSGNAGFGSFRALVLADLPSIPFSNVTGTVPVNQGGTNLTSYTTGQILYASGSGTLAGLSDVATGSVLISGGTSTAPSWASTVPIGTGITFTANPGGGTQSTLNDYETMPSFSAVDGSGAGLTLTTNASSVMKLGKYVFFSLDVSYPSTANSSSAKIVLPYANSATNSLFITNGVGVAGGISVIGATVSGNMVFWQLNNDSQLPNSTFSSARIFTSGMYLSTV